MRRANSRSITKTRIIMKFFVCQQRGKLVLLIVACAIGRALERKHFPMDFKMKRDVTTATRWPCVVNFNYGDISRRRGDTKAPRYWPPRRAVGNGRVTPVMFVFSTKLVQLLRLPFAKLLISVLLNKLLVSAS